MIEVPIVQPSRFDQLRVRHLRFLSILASAGSLASTAERLSLTPSAASMMLKEIEGLFGVKLFRRHGRGMALTEEGKAHMPRCQAVLGEIDAMATNTREPATPLLRVGAFAHTTTTVLPDVIAKLTLGQPAWRVRIVDGSAEQLFQSLLMGEIDVLLGRLPRSAIGSPSLGALRQRVLYEGGLSVVAARDHPLAARRKVSLDDLLHWPWILPGLGSTTRMALVEAFQRQGIDPPTPIVEAPSFFFSLPVVARTQLLTCCATAAAVQSAASTAILPVRLDSLSSSVAILWRRNSAAAQRAVDQMDR